MIANQERTKQMQTLKITLLLTIVYELYHTVNVKSPKCFAMTSRDVKLAIFNVSLFLQGYLTSYDVIKCLQMTKILHSTNTPHVLLSPYIQFTVSFAINIPQYFKIYQNTKNNKIFEKKKFFLMANQERTKSF